MNFKELFEGTEPNLPGASDGVKVMSMAQFLAAGSAGEKSEEDGDGEVVPAELDSDNTDHVSDGPRGKRDVDENFGDTIRKGVKQVKRATQGWGVGAAPDMITPAGAVSAFKNMDGQRLASFVASRKELPEPRKDSAGAFANKVIDREMKQRGYGRVAEGKESNDHLNRIRTLSGLSESTVSEGKEDKIKQLKQDYSDKLRWSTEVHDPAKQRQYRRAAATIAAHLKKQYGIDVGQRVSEATKMPVSARDLKGQELTDYMDRIRNREKNKGDKYKLPYIHRSSVITYYDEAGKTYNVDAIKQAMATRPKKLLKQNEKMKHSNGEFEQFFNIGFAALVGIALDENTNELIVVNTCPGAGSCKVDCFAMKGGKVQFAGPWVSDGRILTFLLNDPEGFKAQLIKEIGKEVKDGEKGSRGFEAGWAVTVRWHDAGDFFSPEYMQLAFEIAEAFPTVKFYAYTKMASAALADKPENFIINWSEGANTTQEKQVKAQDPDLEKTKNSRIVPTKLFYDLLKKDEKKNLVKTDAGAWQPASPEALKELKRRLAAEYGLSVHSILSYDEWQAKKHDSGMKWNVIVAPGEGDVSANSHDVLSTLLLKH